MILSAAAFLTLDYYHLLPQKTYQASDFQIERVVSSVDFNGNGVDDYQDLLLGARADAQNHPAYDGAYVEGGYPPDDRGVCTDVVWRAFKEAGYCLREMVDLDIHRRPQAYPMVEKPDKNIDFRRVRNLKIFFEEHGLSLTLDPDDIKEWQAGDIVIFGADKHIGIISDLRNDKGLAYVIHNGGQPVREEDYLKHDTITGHYRFDASAVDKTMLIAWM